jgi:hypothetical protein
MVRWFIDEPHVANGSPSASAVCEALSLVTSEAKPASHSSLTLHEWHEPTSDEDRVNVCILGICKFFYV